MVLAARSPLPLRFELRSLVAGGLFILLLYNDQQYNLRLRFSPEFDILEKSGTHGLARRAHVSPHFTI